MTELNIADSQSLRIKTITGSNNILNEGAGYGDGSFRSAEEDFDQQFNEWTKNNPEITVVALNTGSTSCYIPDFGIDVRFWATITYVL